MYLHQDCQPYTDTYQPDRDTYQPDTDTYQPDTDTYQPDIPVDSDAVRLQYFQWPLICINLQEHNYTCSIFLGLLATGNMNLVNYV